MYKLVLRLLFLRTGETAHRGATAKPTIYGTQANVNSRSTKNCSILHPNQKPLTIPPFSADVHVRATSLPQMLSCLHQEQCVPKEPLISMLNQYI